MSRDLTGDREGLKALLEKTRSIAVVGCSLKPDRDSHQIARYMMEQGYDVIPVHPAHQEIIGVRSYPDLQSIPIPVDMVNVFRKPEALPDLVDQTIAIQAKSFWTQEGVVHAESTCRALDAGISIVVDQ